MRTYASSDDDAFPNISNWPFVVLRARGGQLRSLRNALRERELPCVCYLETMLEGGTEIEMAATREKPSEQLEILTLATFGDAEVLGPLTRKLSLWR